MTRLLITSDLHQDISKWDRLIDTCRSERPNVILIPGDLLPKWQPWPHAQEQWQKGEFPRILEKLKEASNGAPVLTYFGNDDHHSLVDSMDELERDGLLIHMDQRVIRSHGLVFAGMSRVRDYPFGYKYWTARDGDFLDHPVQYGLRALGALEAHRRRLGTEPSLGERMEALAIQISPEELPNSVWLIHQPPCNFGLDVLSDGTGCGSSDVLEFIREKQPLLTCHGHIHESPHSPGGHWATAIGDSISIQPGQVDTRLHYVTLNIDSAFNIHDLRHSVFGASKFASKRFSGGAGSCGA